MKKIMMFLFVTCLMGGFAVNANAQDAKIDKQLDEYSSYVEKYKDASKKFLEANKNATKDLTSKNDKGKNAAHQTYYNKAKELERNLEQNKSKMNDKQVTKFEKIKKTFQNAVNEYLKATDKRKK